MPWDWFSIWKSRASWLLFEDEMLCTRSKVYSLWALHPLSYWADTYPHPPEWCSTRWASTLKSGCWARWYTPRTGCRSGCQNASPYGARTHWRKEHHFHTPELPYPLQRWFLVWQRTWFHLETQRKELVGFQSKYRQLLLLTRCHSTVSRSCHSISTVVLSRPRQYVLLPPSLGSYYLRPNEWEPTNFVY